MRDGITIVEVMIAIAVLAIAVLALYAAVMSATDLATTNRETDIAMTELQAVMEEVVAVPFGEVPDFAEQASPPAAGAAPPPETPLVGLPAYSDRALTNETVAVTYTGGDIDGYEITATIWWTGHDATVRMEQIATLRRR